MAIYCEAYNLVIPIVNLERVYKGGFKQYLKDKANFLNTICWYDKYLLREGSMDYDGIESKLRKWEALGLKGKENNYRNSWGDFCVFATASSELPNCQWLVFGSQYRYVFMHGTGFDELIVPSRVGFKTHNNRIQSTYWMERLKIDISKNRNFC